MLPKQRGLPGLKRDTVRLREEGVDGLFDEVGAAALLSFRSRIDFSEKFLGECD